MINSLITTVWVFLPAAIANSTPVIAAKIPGLKKLTYPIDGFRTLNGKRILGDHKTVRGFVVGISLAIVTVYWQRNIYLNNPNIQNLIAFNYYSINFLQLGFLLGAGALTGDAVKSFVKRRIGKNPGSSWMPFDQLDYVLGSIIFSWSLVHFKISQYLFLLVLGMLASAISNLTAYLLKIKDVPY